MMFLSTTLNLKLKKNSLNYCQKRFSSSWKKISGLLKKEYGQSILEKNPVLEKYLKNFYFELKEKNPNKSSQQIFQQIQMIFEQKKFQNPQFMENLLNHTKVSNQSNSWFHFKFWERSLNPEVREIKLAFGTVLSFSLGSVYWISNREQVFADKKDQIEQMKKEVTNCLERLQNSNNELWKHIRDDVEHFINNGMKAKQSLEQHYGNQRETISQLRVFTLLSDNSAERFCLKEMDGLEKNFRKLRDILDQYNSNQVVTQYSWAEIANFCKKGSEYYQNLNAQLTETSLIHETLQQKKQSIQQNLQSQITEDSDMVSIEETVQIENPSLSSDISVRPYSPLENNLFTFNKLFQVFLKIFQF